MIGADADSQHLLLQVAWILLWVFLWLAAICILALMAIRARRRYVAERREAELAGLRRELVAVAVGEEPEASWAADHLKSLDGRRSDRADELLVGMLSKVRGDAKERVLEILIARGADRRALRQVGSRRAFARCRGAFALGAMGRQGVTRHVIPLLRDRSQRVRRVATRSLGLLQDPTAARPLLNSANRSGSVQRDVIQSLIQLGAPATPALRERLAYATVRPDASDRSGPAAAAALGLIGDISAAHALATALERGPLPLQLAAAQALGHLDSPAGLAVLQHAVTSAAPQVQLAAATSLGQLGAETGVPALIAAVEQGEPTVSRTAAQALLDLGPRGREALAASTAPYAVEAVALDAMRRPR